MDRGREGGEGRKGREGKRRVQLSNTVSDMLSKCSLRSKAGGLKASSLPILSPSRSTAMGVEPDGADGFQFGERLCSDEGSTGGSEPFVCALTMGGTLAFCCLGCCLERSWTGDAGFTATTMGTRRAAC